MKKTIFIAVCTLFMSANLFAQTTSVNTSWDGVHHDETNCKYTLGEAWCNCSGGACHVFGWWLYTESHPTPNAPFTGVMSLVTGGKVKVVLDQNSAGADGLFTMDADITVSSALATALGKSSITLLAGHYQISSGGTYGTVFINANIL